MLSPPHNPLAATALERFESLLQQRSFELAAAAASELHQVCLGVPDRHWLACARAAEGRLAAHRGQYRSAISLLLKALEDLDRRGARRPFDRAADALAFSLRRVAVVKAAFGVTVKRIRQARRYRRGEVAWAQHRRLEGLVSLLRGQLEVAGPALRCAAAQLLAAGAHRDAGLAVLDWAEVCLADYAGEEALGLAREVLAALWEGRVDLDAVLTFEVFVRRLGAGEGEAAAIEPARRHLSRMQAGA